MTETILITAPRLADEAMAMLEDRQAHVETMSLSATAEEMAANVERLQPDGIISRTVRIDATVIEAARRLKAISKHGAGVDNIDVAAASRRNIPVACTAGTNAQSVAEHAAALLLALARHIPSFASTMAQGRWERGTRPGTELDGRVLGLVGYGAIARRFARIGRGIGMSIHAFDPFIDPTSAEDVTVHEALEELLETADVVSLHCPLMAETRGLIDSSALARMKPSGFLINCARGPIVDEPALVEALSSGLIAGACLDTFATEPLAEDSPLRGMTNVVLTPHVAASTTEAGRRMSVESVQNLFDMLDGKRIAPERLINRTALGL